MNPMKRKSARRSLTARIVSVIMTWILLVTMMPYSVLADGPEGRSSGSVNTAEFSTEIIPEQGANDSELTTTAGSSVDPIESTTVQQPEETTAQPEEETTVQSPEATTTTLAEGTTTIPSDRDKDNEESMQDEDSIVKTIDTPLDFGKYISHALLTVGVGDGSKVYNLKENGSEQPIQVMEGDSVKIEYRFAVSDVKNIDSSVNYEIPLPTCLNYGNMTQTTVDVKDGDLKIGEFSVNSSTKMAYFKFDSKLDFNTIAAIENGFFWISGEAECKEGTGGSDQGTIWIGDSNTDITIAVKPASGTVHVQKAGTYDNKDHTISWIASVINADGTGIPEKSVITDNLITKIEYSDGIWINAVMKNKPLVNAVKDGQKLLLTEGMDYELTTPEGKLFQIILKKDVNADLEITYITEVPFEEFAWLGSQNETGKIQQDNMGVNNRIAYEYQPPEGPKLTDETTVLVPIPFQMIEKKSVEFVSGKDNQVNWEVTLNQQYWKLDAGTILNDAATMGLKLDPDSFNVKIKFNDTYEPVKTSDWLGFSKINDSQYKIKLLQELSVPMQITYRTTSVILPSTDAYNKITLILNKQNFNSQAKLPPIGDGSASLSKVSLSNMGLSNTMGADGKIDGRYAQSLKWKVDFNLSGQKNVRIVDKMPAGTSLILESKPAINGKDWSAMISSTLKELAKMDHFDASVSSNAADLFNDLGMKLDGEPIQLQTPPEADQTSLIYKGIIKNFTGSKESIPITLTVDSKTNTFELKFPDHLEIQGSHSLVYYTSMDSIDYPKDGGSKTVTYTNNLSLHIGEDSVETSAQTSVSNMNPIEKGIDMNKHYNSNTGELGWVFRINRSHYPLAGVKLVDTLEDHAYWDITGWEVRIVQHSGGDHTKNPVVQKGIVENDIGRLTSTGQNAVNLPEGYNKDAVLDLSNYNEKGQITYDMGDIDGSYYLYLTAKMNQAGREYYFSKTDAKVEVVNQVTLQTGEAVYHSSAAEQLNNLKKQIDKKGIYSEKTEDIAWNIILNEGHSALDALGSESFVKDTMPKGLYLAGTPSLFVKEGKDSEWKSAEHYYEKDGSVTSVTEGDKTIYKFKVPTWEAGSTAAYRIEYTTNIDWEAAEANGGIFRFSNDAAWMGNRIGSESGSDEVVIQKADIGGGAEVNKFVAIQFRKVDSENNNTGLAGAEFQIYQGDTLYSPVVFVSDQDGFVKIPGLKADQIYTIKETKAPNGYVAITEPKEVWSGIPKDLQDQKDSKLIQLPAVANKAIVYAVSIQKTADSNKDLLLNGAEFVLMKGDVEAGRAKTDEKGRLQFTELQPGEYTMKETIAPNGYQIRTGTITIQISEDGILTLVQGAEGYTLTDNVIQVTDKAVDNPGTGGGGNPGGSTPGGNNPGTSTPGTGGTTETPDVDIPDTDIPETNEPDIDIPEDTIPKADGSQNKEPEPDDKVVNVDDDSIPLAKKDKTKPKSEVTVKEDEVPMGQLPKTGQSMKNVLYVSAGLMAGALLCAELLLKRRKKNQ